MIQQEKLYYSQKEIIDCLSRETGLSVYDIARLFQALEKFVTEKFSSKNNHVELKLFSGLKISSRFMPAKQSSSNLYQSGYIHSKNMLFLSADFSKRFRKKIRELRHKNE